MRGMSEPNAAGRKTDLPRYVSGQVEALLTKQIETLGEGVLDSVGLARVLSNVDNDRDGSARTGAVDDAVKFAKMSARLARAMARWRGEVSYKFHYSHSPRDGALPVEIALENPARSDTPKQVARRANDIEEGRAATAKYLQEQRRTLPPQNPGFE